MLQGSSSVSTDWTCMPQVKAYARITNAEKQQLTTRDSSVRIPVMVSIVASSGMVKQRVPVDIVLVLHVHTDCTAPGNWHDLLNQATKLIVDELGDDDRLAIVPALLKETKIISEDVVIVPVKPKLLEMSSENKISHTNAVESSKAMRTNTTLVRELETAESILYSRGADEKERCGGYIIVISNSNENVSSQLLTCWRFRSVHAFGFRDANNARTMCSIASSRESTYATLDNEDGYITEAFSASIGKITSAVEPVQVKLKCNQEVVLSAIDAPRISYFISYDKKFGIIWASTNPAVTATNNFIVHLDVRGDDYYETDTGNLLTLEVMNGHHPPVVAVREGTYQSKEVAAEMVRMEAVKQVTGIINDDCGQFHFHEAADKLREWWTRVEQSNHGREVSDAGLISGLAAEIREMETRLHNNYMWLECMLSWRSQLWWQPVRLLMADKNQQAAAVATHDDNNHVRLRIFAKVDALPSAIQKPQQGLPVLVHILLPVEALAKVKRVPLDLIAVLGVGCRDKETKEKRMWLVKMAMELVMDKLSHHDRLAILPAVQSAFTTEPAALLYMTKQTRREYAQRLPVVVAPSAKKATQQISHLVQRLNKLATSKCLTVTAVNSSATAQLVSLPGSTNLSKSLMNAFQLLDARTGNNTERMGIIIVISDISDTNDLPILQSTLSFNKYTIHAFSFGGADNARSMEYMATRTSSGIYGIVDDNRDRITDTFVSCIREMTSIIAVDTEVDIKCSESSSVTLSTIESGRFNSSIHDNKSGSILVGALCAGAERRFIAYMENVEDNCSSLPNMLQVNVTWQSKWQGARKIQGKVDIVKDGDEGSMEVVAEIDRIKGGQNHQCVY